MADESEIKDPSAPPQVSPPAAAAGATGVPDPMTLHIPPDATEWALRRRQATGWEICSIHVAGGKIERFSTKTSAPDMVAIRDLWGSGTYRIDYFRTDGSCRRARAFTIDDPAKPQRAAYCGAPQAGTVAAPETASPVAAPPEAPQLGLAGLGASAGGPLDMTALLSSALGGSASSAIPLVLAILNFQTQMLAATRAEEQARFERHQAEERRRSEERDKEHERAMDRMRRQSQDEQKAIAAFWREQARTAREMSAPDELEEIKEAIDALKQDRSIVEQIAQFAPLVEKLLPSRGGGILPPANGAA